ncbi:hypothetical protein D0Y83_12480 [Qipengyuania flava]|uniref:Uncharacterized protein n=1 Tax=Qipengyuania flava TaxID=192812 RepID=A0A5P6NFN3_9SPHN|nr:hypothetical protein [Qipengyuania flava]QFI63993.1 hypothetical protein D0Y83_12480 [Qipengyuania flava]
MPPALLQKLLRRFERNRTVTISIGFNQGASFVSALLLVTMLADHPLQYAIALLAFAGFVSGAAASNTTARIYANLKHAVNPESIARLALLLFCFEQVCSLLLTSIVIVVFAPMTNFVTPLQAILLGASASSGSLLAFSKYNAKALTRLNYFRGSIVVLRTTLILAAASWGKGEAIFAIVFISFSLPTIFSLFLTLHLFIKGRSTDVVEQTGGSQSAESAVKVLREYAFGVPVAIARAFVNQGLIIVAVSILSADELRIFRFLLIPKDLVNRTFNALLPLTFDRLYDSRPNRNRLLVIGFGAVALSCLWYVGGAIVLEYGYFDLLAFGVFMVMNLAVYTVLPIIWRAIYADRALQNMAVVLFSLGALLGAGWISRPETVSGIFVLMSVYLLCYITLTIKIAGLSKYSDKT